MDKIKKPFEELFTVLNKNKDKQVADILPDLIEIMTSKVMNSTHKKDEKGNITEIFCYYHKRWEKLSEHEYGPKSNSTTGYNTMCKKGVNHWSKQQREKKKLEAELLDKLIAGEITPEQASDEQINIIEHSKRIEE